jgi:hypothetical protein
MKLHLTTSKQHPQQPNQSNQPLIKHQNLADLQVLSQLSNSRFPVFLVLSPDLNKKCALKVYPYEKEAPSPSYINELRFHFLSHENIIGMHAHNHKQKTSSGDKKFSSSCILLELAPFGDFTDLITNKKIYQDQAVVRTFFPSINRRNRLSPPNGSSSH